MILYKCECGARLTVTENTEESRNEKRAFKKAHGKRRGNPGHKWERRKAKKEGQ